MKISQMNNEQLGRCLASLVEPIANLMDDEEFVKPLVAVCKDFTKVEIGDAIKSIAPVLLTKHMGDVEMVVAALEDKPLEEIKKQKGLLTISQLVKSFDKELFAFFSSSGDTEQQALSPELQPQA